MTLDWQITALNPPFGDPGFILRHQHLGETLFFDLGELAHRAPGELLKAELIFISHAHIDHLIGFDHLLRLNLNRPRHLRFFGPPGLARVIGHKLQGYLWNLTSHYELLISVSEIESRQLKSTTFACRKKFAPETSGNCPRDGNIVYHNPHFIIRAATLDHGTPCMAYVLEERKKVSFRPEKLRQLNLKPGPWLTGFRKLLQGEAALDKTIDIGPQSFQAGQLATEIACISRGRKIAYVTDIGWSESNLGRLLALVDEPDLLLCEAAFLEESAGKAGDSHHLTAAQAGHLAGRWRAKRLHLFHFSPRHQHSGDEFRRQAAEFFAGTIEI